MEPNDFRHDGEGLFHQFCDTIETSSDGTTISQNPNGVGMPLALNNFAKFFQKHYLGADCPAGACLNTYDYSADVYTNYTVGNANERQWLWMVCNQFGWWQGNAVSLRPQAIAR